MSKDYLGKGWKFPIQVDAKTGRIMMSEHEDDIAEAIRIILQTSRGERVMRPEFGCGIQRFAFSSTDDTTLRLMEASVREAIIAWEPRVGDVEVQAEPDRESPEKVQIHVKYLVRSTNNLYNLVYPFYIYEGAK